MKILSVDTSSSNCAVALLEDYNLIGENSLNNGKTHSENLMPLIEELLKRNKTSLNEIDLMAVSAGPGSFTGIRIGISSVKAMAFVNNTKVVSVTSLETLARIDESARNKACLIDCKNDQVYFAIFDKNYNLIEDYKACDINEVIPTIKKYKDIVLIGDGAILHKDILQSVLNKVEILDNCMQTAENVGKMGYKKFLDGKYETASSVTPFYLRKSQAERLKK